ncbi:outer membrane beta-barrel family protein [Mucilaginibacter sp. UR6-11]|uniref:outer membrane beta-barrel family protein n=1 Tax=Mucilaginibacter sp. UR6-11 TaxID=1435644 RepID=UPI001E364D35|nr:outer membrane beta-barrel family protein [Mucilaginibacter sp. UR6-11]MCC8426183.1 TonB-dependent receptor [Mucilaginibacter sp. UR6-11]
MTELKKAIYVIALILLSRDVYSQSMPAGGGAFSLIILNEKSQPAEGAEVKQLKDNQPVKTAVANARGVARFEGLAIGTYTFVVNYTGYKEQITRTYNFTGNTFADTIRLQPLNTNLQQVTVVATVPPIENKQGKTILNIGSSVTNAGSTVLEVLEKSPGITVDRNGGIAMKGKAGVLVLIDNKPTYLSGADLNNLLSSMSSSNVQQIELIANPTAKYDASGNAGIINIKTKKNKQQGFNGSFNITGGVGVYPKNNESVVLNYRTGKVNLFFNYNATLLKYLTNLYALRKYYDINNNLTAQLDQPGGFRGTLFNNIIKTGLDYSVNSNTTLGFAIGGIAVSRVGGNVGTATWLNPAGMADSAIYTTNKTNNQLRNGSVNFNARHTISSSQDLTADFDWLHYTTQSDQDYDNKLLTAGGYDEQSRGNIPSTINIGSGKIDYSWKMGKDLSFQSGWKSSFSKTDNAASYQNLAGTQWVDDNSRNNRFLYKENIHALYGTLENKYKKISYQAGIRYEYTSYNAHQYGNATQKDSAFRKNYGGFFPSGYITYQPDTANGFTLTVGRRVDRPAFQLLNPFLSIVNKYTYITGNPLILPQYTWNFELGHQYKNWLTTTVSYSTIKNYFSQIFLNGATKDIILYTQGNVGHTGNFGLSTTVVLAPLTWWSFTANIVYNHKQLKGFNGNTYTTAIDQFNFNLNNQFTIAKNYTAEVSGFYTTKARNDVQELLYPTGQLSAGISRPILNKKGTLKLIARDILYTNAMEGLTQFPNSTEYFKLTRDSRVILLSFTYRFGKAYKTVKHASGVSDEMQRVGNG